jgi:integration host factor subunit beta
MMIKSELVDVIARKDLQLERADIERAVNLLLEHMSLALAAGERIEIRGFGSFSLRFRRPRLGRNPKTGEAVSLTGKHVPRFKPGKLLRDRVNAARMH